MSGPGMPDEDTADEDTSEAHVEALRDLVEASKSLDNDPAMQAIIDNAARVVAKADGEPYRPLMPDLLGCSMNPDGWLQYEKTGEAK